MGMKIGTETASLSNHLLSRATRGQPNPKVGMGCTFLSWTDRSAGTIQKVTELSSKAWSFEIEVTSDDAKRIDKNGLSEAQEYEFTERPDGPRAIYRCKRETGEWIQMRKNESGRMVISRGRGLRIGERSAYHDFSF